MDKLLRDTLDAAALRPESQNDHLHPIFKEAVNSFLVPMIKPGDKESVASAFEAQTLLRAAVNWHQAHEGEVLPTPLLLILCAARRVC